MSTNPNTVKSQDDLSTTNDGKRSSDVLLSTIERCERLQKQLDIAVKALETTHTFPHTMTLKEWCEKKLAEIKELDNDNQAK